MATVHFPKVATAMLAVVPVFLGNSGTVGLAVQLANHPAVELIAARDTVRSDSGIAGQVEIRPIRPHVTIGVPDTQPYQAKIEVLDANGHAVTTVEADPRGSFRVTLPPGKYILRPQSSGLYPRASQQSVVVAPQRFTQVRITYDSGIR